MRREGFPAVPAGDVGRGDAGAVRGGVDRGADRNAEVLKHARSEELREAVPEAVKNMLLVMSAQGVLAPGAPEGIWETTWKKAAAIDAGLTPAIVGAK